MWLFSPAASTAGIIMPTHALTGKSASSRFNTNSVFLAFLVKQLIFDKLEHMKNPEPAARIQNMEPVVNLLERVTATLCFTGLLTYAPATI